MIFWVFVDSWVELNPVTQILVLYEVSEFVWSPIWVVVLAGLSLRVAVLTGDGCPGGGGSSSGWRVFCCTLRLVEWDSFVTPSRLPSRSSSAFPLMMDLAIADLSFKTAVLLRGGCPGGGGSSSGWRVLRCVLRFVERDSFIKPSRLPSRSSSSSSSVMDLAAAIILVLALQAE